jgi:protein-disulfide isomerase
MSSNENMTRKQRRAAERATKKGDKGNSTKSGSSGGSSGPSMLLISLGAIAIGVVAVLALVLVSGGLGGDDVTAINEPDTPAPAEELRQGRTLVAPDAEPPVTVEVFEDPQCPHCATFTTRIEPLLIAEHVENGTASFTYNDYIVFGDESLDAAVAMRAADQLDDKFWDFHHILFYNQEGIDDGSFSRERLADMAEMVGLDRDEFLALLDDDELRDGVTEDMQSGVEYGLSSTPTLVINGEVHAGVPTWDDLDTLIKDAAAAAE